MLRRALPHLLRATAALRLAPRPAPPPLPRHYRPSAPRLRDAARPPQPPQPQPPPAEDPLPPDATVSQRLKHLVRSYGWYALGVYLVFSALDFTVAFVGINLLGAQQVSQAAAHVKHTISGLLYSNPPEPGRDEIDSPSAGNGSQEGLYAMLVLAYTVHKTLFLPLRVGLTAALTPRIVGWLRARGWAGGQGAKRASELGERIRITRDKK